MEKENENEKEKGKEKTRRRGVPGVSYRRRQLTIDSRNPSPYNRIRYLQERKKKEKKINMILIPLITV